MSNIFTARPAAIVRTLGHEIVFGLPIWAAFLLALEPDNVARAINSGSPLAFSEEAIRITGASLLGALSTPVVLALIRRFPIERDKLWRNLSVQGVGNAAIAFGLIVVSCVLAATFKIGDARPVLVALPHQISANWLLLIFCLMALGAIAQVIHFARTKPQPVAKAAPASAFLTSVAVKSRGCVTPVALETVDWIESQGNYLALHTNGGVHLLREALQSFEAKVDPRRFVRIHRRMLVAVDRISELSAVGNGDAEVRLKDGTTLRVSRSFRDKVRRALGADN